MLCYASEEEKSPKGVGRLGAPKVRIGGRFCTRGNLMHGTRESGVVVFIVGAVDR